MNKLKERIMDLWDDRYMFIPFRDFYMDIKYFIQRGKRGYSDRDVWNFDYYIATVLKDGIKDLRDNHCGYPANLTEEKWDNKLDEMIDGFKYYDRESELMGGCDWDVDVYMKEEDKLRKKLDKSLKLLSKYFMSLWD